MVIWSYVIYRNIRKMQAAKENVSTSFLLSHPLGDDTVGKRSFTHLHFFYRSTCHMSDKKNAYPCRMTRIGAVLKCKS